MGLENIINLLPEILPVEKWPYKKAQPYKSDYITKTSLENWVMLKLNYNFLFFKKIPRYPESLQAFHAFCQEKMKCQLPFNPKEVGVGDTRIMGERRISLSNEHSKILAGINTNDGYFYFAFHKDDAAAKSIVGEFLKMLNSNYVKIENK